MSSEEHVEELLNRWEDLREQGEDISAEELCRDCPELASVVQERIAELRRIDRFLSTGQLGGSADELTPAGRYRPVQLHAQGGLGEVFIARDDELNRQVALKRILPAQSQIPDRRHRFQFEAEITGNLEHPGIVPVYGLGYDGHGCLYYAMRFIHGETLQQAVERFHRTYPPGREFGAQAMAFQKLIRSFLTVCQTIAYAHGQKVIHRDIKPANIMLGHYGETLVVDWGLAKQIGKQDTAPPPIPTEATVTVENNRPTSSPVDETLFGQIKGSPAYMSPEQAEGAIGNIGVRSDVYSLGATLYAILTGHTPLAGKSLTEILDKVRRGDFPRPRQLRADLSKPLEAICLKAMSHNPSDRYETALALAADIEHWLAGDPVSAWKEPWTVRAGRWMRRHQTLVSTTSAAVLVALLGLGVVAALQRQANRTLGEKNEQLVAANASESKARKKAEEMEIEARAAEAKTREANRQLRREFYRFQIVSVDKALNENARALAESLLLQCPEDLRNVEWRILYRRCMGSRLTVKSPSGFAGSVACAIDGTRFATATGTDPVRVYRTADSGLEAELPGPARKVSWLPDGDRLVVHREPELELWSVIQRKCIQKLGAHSRFELSPDGGQIAVIDTSWPRSADKNSLPVFQITVLDTVSGKQLVQFDKIQGELFSLKFSPAGDRLFVGLRLFDPKTPPKRTSNRFLYFATIFYPWAGSEVMAWDLKTRLQLFVTKLPDQSNPADMVLTPDGSDILISLGGTSGRRIGMIDTTTGKIADLTTWGLWVPSLNAEGGKDLFQVWQSKEVCGAMAMSPEGRVAMVVGNSVIVFDLHHGGKRITEFHGHTRTPVCLAFAGSNQVLSAGGNDGAIKLWRIDNPLADRRVLAAKEPSCAAFSSDSQRIAIGDWDGSIGIFDVSSGSTIQTVPLLLTIVDQKKLEEGDKRYPWNLSSGALPTSLNFSSDGKQLRVIYDDRIVCLWDLTSSVPKLASYFDERTLEPTGPTHSGSSPDLSLSPDGRYLLAVSRPKGNEKTCECRVWEIATKRLVLRHGGDRWTTGDCRFCFSRDSSRFMIDRSRENGSPAVLAWDTGNGQPVDASGKHQVIDPRYGTPDGTRVVRTVRSGKSEAEKWIEASIVIEDGDTRAPVLSIADNVYDEAIFSPNGQYLACRREHAVDLLDASRIVPPPQP